ncbi:MAG: cytoskeleton protein RodZ [Alphaproteobacteria bacterium]|jgi:cytoskeleton protein RodZ
MATNASSVEAATQAVEFGASMREMRRAHNRELTDVSAILKIRLVYLQAIEDGRFNALPGPTYAMGFVRAYADYLGLDLVEVMRRYREITGDQPAQGPLVPPSPVIEARLPTGFILLVAAVLALAAYGGWYYLTVDGRDPVEVVTKLPARIAAMVGLDKDANDKPLPASTAKPGAENKENAAAAASSSPSSNMPSPETAVATASVSSPGGKPVVTVSAAERPKANALLPDATVPPVTVSPVTVSPVTVSSMPVATTSSASTTEIASSSETTTQVDRPAASSLPETSPPESSPPESSPPPEAVRSPSPTPSAPPQTMEVVPEAAREVPESATPVLQLTPPAPRTDTATVSAALPEAQAASAFATGRVILRASAITWVELRDASGKRLYSRLMKRGETFTVPPTGGVVLETGNAGGLDILVDGTAIASLGPQGAVRRGILLEPDTLLGGASGRR